DSITKNKDAEFERFATIVEPFYTDFENSEAQRSLDIEELVGQLGPGPITISTFNEGFLELFRNWVASCDYHNIEVRDSSIMFPMDEISHDAALSLGFKSLFREQSFGPVPREAAGVYGDSRFVACMFAKNAIVQTMLTFDRDILFQDIDMVWQKDPRAWLEDRARTENLDFQFMYDGFNPRFQPLYYNSGFFYIRANEFTRKVWDVVYNNYDKVLYYRSQQVPLNIIMNTFRERGLRTERMPEDTFVNGHRFHIDPHRFDLDLISEGYVVHCSWTHNLEKKFEKFKLYNSWYLD
ncbi:MAG: hypothetical protein HOJ88_04545, partial [Proteobacteria bacterium]|nr:hypothetical protein [Pseudomonadota bacterium]